MLKKYCPKCKRTREYFYFRKSKERKNGLDAYCKECSTCLHRRHYLIKKLREPNHFNQIATEHYWKHRDRHLLRSKEWRKKNLLLIKERARNKRQLYKTDFNAFVGYLYFGMHNRINYKAKYKCRNLGLCSKNEFIEFTNNNSRLREMFEHWKDMNNDMWLKPTVDRIDNERGYEIDNIQFISHRQNTEKGRLEYKKMLSGYRSYIQNVAKP